MKNLLTKILSIALLSLAAMPSGIQARLSENTLFRVGILAGTRIAVNTEVRPKVRLAIGVLVATKLIKNDKALGTASGTTATVIAGVIEGVSSGEEETVKIIAVATGAMVGAIIGTEVGAMIGEAQTVRRLLATTREEEIIILGAGLAAGTIVGAELGAKLGVAMVQKMIEKLFWLKNNSRWNNRTVQAKQDLSKG